MTGPLETHPAGERIASVTARQRQLLYRRSPHYGSRRGAAVRWVVLHADVSPRESATLDWLCDPRSQVSYHVLIHRNGDLTRLVADDRAAWACGVSRWKGVEYLNRHSLSLAFSNRHNGEEEITAAQRATALWQLSVWRQSYPIEEILTHAMISPGRKTDPDRIPNFRLEDYA